MPLSRLPGLHSVLACPHGGRVAFDVFSAASFLSSRSRASSLARAFRFGFSSVETISHAVRTFFRSFTEASIMAFLSWSFRSR